MIGTRLWVAKSFPLIKLGRGKFSLGNVPDLVGFFFASEKNIPNMAGD